MGEFRPSPPARTAALAGLALAGFATNSLLCRAALRGGAIDAWSFTCVRLASGAAVLALLARGRSSSEGSWTSAAALVAYAGAFSLAYLRLPAGIGALVLFGAVQATMIGWSIRAGKHPSAPEWCGLALALAGLAYLTLPGASAPDALGLGLMAAAGISWGVYSLRGRSSRTPLLATAGNFARGVPLVLLFVVFASPAASVRGLALACASGALASGLGYSLWYAALPGLSATRAALVQLVVPVLTALAGVGLLGEELTRRLLIAGALILGGIALALLRPQRRSE